MEALKSTLIHCLLENSGDENKFLHEFDRIVEHEGNAAFAALLQLLTHLEFDAEEARDNWKGILAHKEGLSLQLGRQVDLLTAICDYFSNVKKELRAPKVIELEAFEKTLGTSKYDSLTGLHSRGFFDEALITEVNRSSRYNAEFSLLFLDLDDFKRINDNFGHQAGDLALASVGKLILQEKRTEDIAARYGGEEFVIILPETGKARALVIAERIRKKAEAMSLAFEGETFKLTLSGGIASFPADAELPLELVHRADKAMYLAKQNGKNNIFIFARNKRRYIRADFYGEVKIDALQKKGDREQVVAKGKNISEGGILFESSQELTLGDHLQIQIPVPTGAPIHFVGQVVRVEDVGGRFDIGVSFLKLLGESKDQFTQYLMGQLGLRE